MPIPISLYRVPTLKLLNIWISLQSKEQFIEKASQLVEIEVGYEECPPLLKRKKL